MKKKVVGIDFGQKRIGVAISSGVGSLTTPLGVIKRSFKIEETFQSLFALLEKYGEIDHFVIGLPLHLSGKESEQSLLVREFAKHLEVASKRKVAFIDERLTSKAIETSLREKSVSRKKQASIVDTLAASLLLENYLDLSTLAINK